MTCYKSSFISGESLRSETLEDLFVENFDLVILTSSWDRRSVVISEARLLAKKVILLDFEYKDSCGLRELHDKKLNCFIVSLGVEKIVISDSSTNYSSLWEKLKSAIEDVFLLNSRPIDILIDLSSCPRYYTLATLGYCLRKGIVRSLTFFYAEGKYKENKKNDHIFTKGNWRIINIPQFEGENFPGKQKIFLVSVGFEGDKTLQIVSKEDPDRVTLLFPDPGTSLQYVEKAKVNNEIIVNKYCIPNSHIIHVNACDAILAWNYLEKFIKDDGLSGDTFFLCCGTKPHALALSLCAFSHGFPKLLYRAPEKYEVMDIFPNGVYWKYKIMDLSVV